LQRAAAKVIEVGISLVFHSRMEPMWLNLVAHVRRPFGEDGPGRSVRA
jgi:hypothetical protein